MSTFDYPPKDNTDDTKKELEKKLDALNRAESTTVENMTTLLKQGEDLRKRLEALEKEPTKDTNKTAEIKENIEKLKSELTRVNEELAQKEKVKEKSKSLVQRLSKTRISTEKMAEMGLKEETIKEIMEKREGTSSQDPENVTPSPEEPKNKDQKIEDIKEETLKVFKKKELDDQEKILDQKLKEIGLSDANFSSMPGWATLTTAQKILVVDQASQETLAKVKEEAKNRFNQASTTDISKDTAPEYLWKIWKRFTKAYWINDEAKKAVLEAAQGKLTPKEETLQTLVERTADMNLQVTLKDGKPVIEFASSSAAILEAEKDLINTYNEIANEFARMPDAWKNEKAAKSTTAFSKKNYEKYTEVKGRYEKTRNALVDIKTEEYKHAGLSEKDAQFQAMTDMKDSDFQIAMLQFTNTNPDAFGELRKIHDSSSFKKLFKDNESIWRGIYFGSGWIARSAAITTLGTMTGPLIASVIGGWRARRQAGEKINTAFQEGRTMESFREMTAEERLNRRGQMETDKHGNIIRKKFNEKTKKWEINYDGLYENKNAKKGLAAKVLSGNEVSVREVATFVDADSQIQRLSHLMEKLEGTRNIKERAELISSLRARVDYIEAKHTEGLVNYGEKNPIGLNYQLLKTVSEASVRAQEDSVYFHPEVDLSKITDANVVDKLDPEFLDAAADMQTVADRQNRRAELMQKVTDYNRAQSEFNQRYFKNTETARGALVGAGFAVLGLKVRGWIHGDNPFNYLRQKYHELTSVGVATGETKIPSPIDHTHTPTTTTPETTTPKVTPHNPEPETKTVPEQKTPEGAKPATGTPQKTPEGVTPRQTVPKGVNSTPAQTVPKGIDSTPVQTIPKGVDQTPTTNPVQTNPENIQNVPRVETQTTPEGVTTNPTEIRPIGEKPFVDAPLGKASTAFDTDQTTPSGIPQRPPEGLGTLDQRDPTGLTGNSTTGIEQQNPTGLGNAQETIQTTPKGLTETPTTGTAQRTPEGLTGNQGSLQKAPEGLTETPTTTGVPQKTPEGITETSGTIQRNPDGTLASNQKIPDGLTSKEIPVRGLNTENTDGFTPVKNPFRSPYDGSANQGTHPIEQMSDKNPDVHNNIRQVETERDIRHRFRPRNVNIEEPRTDEINGEKYSTWNKESDQLFKNKGIKFPNYSAYEKEDELQRLFGKWDKSIVYDARLDKNVVHGMTYFRERPEWPIIQKIPAKYFLNDFESIKLADGTQLPKADLETLVKSGILRDEVSIIDNQEVHDYVFVNKEELARLSRVYGTIEPNNQVPIGDENIERFVARATRDVTEADDGTMYVLRKDADVSRIRYGRLPSRTIPPSNGGVRYGNYGPYNQTVTRGGQIIGRALNGWLGRGGY